VPLLARPKFVHEYIHDTASAGQAVRAAIRRSTRRKTETPHSERGVSGFMFWFGTNFAAVTGSI